MKATVFDSFSKKAREGTTTNIQFDPGLIKSVEFDKDEKCYIIQGFPELLTIPDNFNATESSLFVRVTDLDLYITGEITLSDGDVLIANVDMSLGEKNMLLLSLLKNLNQ